MALSLLAGGLGAALGTGDSWAGNFFSQHQAQSSQSYSAAVARDLGLMNQYFTAQNMEYSKILQSMLNAESYGYNTSLQKLQAELQEALNKSSYGTSYEYEKALAEYSRYLNSVSADEDYARSVSYVRDNLLAYKHALKEAGYNPLLALGSSAAQYSGHTNPASFGSLSSGGNVSGSSVSSGSAHGSSPGGGSISAPTSSVQSSAFAQNLKAGVDLARSASEVQNMDSATEKNKAETVRALEAAKTDAESRGPNTSKTESEIIRNYGSTASSILGTIGGAWAASKTGKAVKQFLNTFRRSGSSVSVSAPAASKVASTLADTAVSPTSATIGSRMLQALIPSFTVGTAAAVGAKGMNDAVKGAKSRDSNWYDKWRRIYFPMTGGF